MCGFAGIIWKNPTDRQKTASILAGFERAIFHRGPDEGGIFADDVFGVVTRRLAIIDISQGHQPMTAEDGQVGIGYNGEVYNHAALRKELEAKGHQFTTHCDTEVVLHMYLEYGIDGFERLDGMFAFVIWDRRFADPAYYLVRDHFGAKPLYVYEDEERIAFASELRALLDLPDVFLALSEAGIQSYLTFRYVAGSDTLYKNIRRVEAGSLWRVGARAIVRKRYWDLPPQSAGVLISEQDACDHLFFLLRQSVSAQLMSEVPVGLLLSGGLDSSVIANLCGDLGSRLKSFNIGFPEANEFRYSSEVARAFQLDHVTVETSVKQILARFDRVIEAMDEPIADPACFPLQVLCDEIKQHVTVVLSGEGSDEMMGGYPQYLHLLNSPPASQEDQFASFLRHSWYFTDDVAAVLNQPRAMASWKNSSYFRERSLLEGMLAFDLKTWLPENLLMKADKILMAHSLEGRFPFLSRAIVEFLCSLPEELKVGPDGGKHILRCAFKARLPKLILQRPKMGFTVPVDLLVAELRERCFDLLASLRTSPLAGVVDLPKIQSRFEAHYSGKQPNALWVWTLIVLMQWLSARPVRLAPGRQRVVGFLNPVAYAARGSSSSVIQ